MKGNKLIFLVSSLLLLTLSSGLLFYKSLFMIDTPHSAGKIDFEELRFTDQQVNATVLMMRKNLNPDSSALESELARIKELLNIVTDVNKSSTEVQESVKKIRDFFNKKILDTTHFEEAIKDLKYAVDALRPLLIELNKNNLKFSVDKKDFYQECVLSALFYVTIPSKEHELPLVENRKILGQILSYANTPHPIIQKFTNNIDIILKRTKEIEKFTDTFIIESPISNEMNIIGKNFLEAQESKTHDGQIFLTLVFAAIVLYLLCLVFLVKKFS